MKGIKLELGQHQAEFCSRSLYIHCPPQLNETFIHNPKSTKCCPRWGRYWDIERHTLHLQGAHYWPCTQIILSRPLCSTIEDEASMRGKAKWRRMEESSVENMALIWACKDGQNV